MDTDARSRGPVLLVQPNYAHGKTREAIGAHPPLGLMYIAARLEGAGVPVEILDANTGALSPAECAQKIIARKPAIVGFTFLAPTHDFATEVVRALPKGEFLTVAGGPQASAIPARVIEDGFDRVVRGEGEEPMVALATGTPSEQIAGLSYRSADGTIVHNPQGPALDPNKVPLPARHLLEKNGVDKPYWSGGTRYYPWAPILTSRGCPYGCNYCNRLVFGRGFRPRTPENVLAEIDDLVIRYGVRELDIYDDSFNVNIERAERIMDLLIERRHGLHLRFANGIRADRVNERLLEKMKRAGTGYVAYGIESGDARVLDRVSKGLRLDDVERAVRMTRQQGIFTVGFFMLGLIGDTEESMQRTIDFAKSLDLDAAQFAIATPYPGTEMWELINSEGTIDLHHWAELFHSSGKVCWSWPGAPDGRAIENAYRRAYRDYYLRPRYVLQRLPDLFRPGNLGMLKNGVKRVVEAVLKG
jgi:radical SAM superfamily enzyme YgiQ (UPF0313 family)